MSAILQHVVDAVALGSLYALTALGIGLIFGVMRLINFAHGDFIMVGAFSLVVPTSAATSTLLIGAWPAPSADRRGLRGGDRAGAGDGASRL